MYNKIMIKKRKYIGVVYNKAKRLWEARISIGEFRIHICEAEDDVTAALIRDYAAKLLFGSHAKLNLPGWELPDKVPTAYIRARLARYGLVEK